VIEEDAGEAPLWPSVALGWSLRIRCCLDAVPAAASARLVLLYAIAASAWEYRRRLRGSTVGHVVFFGCGAYASMAAYSHFALPPLVGIPVGVAVAVLIAAVIGVPTLRLSGALFQHGDHRRRRTGATDRHQHRISRRGRGAQRSDRAANRVRSLLHLGIALLLSVPQSCSRSRLASPGGWHSRMGFYLRAIQGFERAARSLGAPASRTKTLCLQC